MKPDEALWMVIYMARGARQADSVEALTAKQKLLQKQFDEQAKKAEAAEKALKKMRDNGIEPTNPAYQKMQQHQSRHGENSKGNRRHF